jgi:hypothetical protein
VKSNRLGIRSGIAAVSLFLGQAAAQQAAPAADSAAVKVGPAEIAPHWSKYQYPRSVPEGAPYHIVERGDTMWDLSSRYLGNPYLWPQIWNQNKYVTDAHWIYPGDPLLLPEIALVSPTAGSPAGPGTGTPDEGPGEGEGAGEGAASVLYPITEDSTLRCSHYIVPSREDESLKVHGSEEGTDKNAFGDRDILYLNRGSNGGVKVGDVYSLHHAAYVVKHPASAKKLGTKVETTGWGRVLLVTEDSATLMVEQACMDILAGDYLKPFEPGNVPLGLRRPPPDRLTPATGKAGGYVVDIAENLGIAGTGQLVSIDLGSQSGITPGNLFSVYRIVYPDKPTPRHVVGELAVLTVKDQTATAKVMYSRDAIIPGDQVELR